MQDVFPGGAPSGGGAPVIMVGVSGGADSMCLAVLADDWAKRLGGRMLAVTVDHGLRPESSAEAMSVSGWMGEIGIEHEIIRWHGGDAQESAVQARARDARYALMATRAGEIGASHLLVAHHLNDQAETFIMRLRHQSGLDGLAGMAPMRGLPGTDCILARPLLGVNKDRLVATLVAAGHRWIEDPSNDNTRFERVRTRLLLGELEKTEKLDPGSIARAANACARVRGVLDGAAGEFISRELHTEGAGGALAVSLPALNDLHPEIARRVLGAIITRLVPARYRPAPGKLQRMQEWLGRAGGQGAMTLGGCRVAKKTGFARFSPEKGRFRGKAPHLAVSGHG